MNALKTAIVQTECELLMTRWNRSRVLPECLAVVVLCKDMDHGSKTAVSSFINVRECDLAVAAYNLAGLIQEILQKIGELAREPDDESEGK